MKNIVGCLLMAVLCTGCVAHMVETHGDKVSLFASAKDKQGRGGVIRFLNTGLQSWRQSRRQDALHQMRHFCAGSYRIIAEGPRSQFGVTMPIGNSVSFEVDQYTYMSFECAKQPAP